MVWHKVIWYGNEIKIKNKVIWYGEGLYLYGMVRHYGYDIRIRVYGENI